MQVHQEDLDPLTILHLCLAPQLFLILPQQFRLLGQPLQRVAQELCEIGIRNDARGARHVWLRRARRGRAVLHNASW